jgi:hypothetical protein
MTCEGRYENCIVAGNALNFVTFNIVYIFYNIEKVLKIVTFCIRRRIIM